MASTGSHETYYVPEQTRLPFFASIGLFLTVFGLGNVLNDIQASESTAVSTWMALIGFTLLSFILFQWFSTVIRENHAGMNSDQLKRSYVWGMAWFICSEVMFFAAFFGALFYARAFILPWLSGEGDGVLTNTYLWQGFVAGWPSNGPAEIGGAFEIIPAWGLPLINTLILLTSGVTITMAHHALKANARTGLLWWLGATVLLGVIFLGLQAEEYVHAYQELNLTLGSGIYGSTFFMLTGFHGMHVMLGTIMLAVMWLRCAKGHFSKDHHFAFEAVAWYWHFVDVVWLLLFLFVYVL